jgi:hypothetical protein
MALRELTAVIISDGRRKEKEKRERQTWAADQLVACSSA